MYKFAKKYERIPLSKADQKQTGKTEIRVNIDNNCKFIIIWGGIGGYGGGVKQEGGKGGPDYFSNPQEQRPALEKP